jgi:hypothetical protein
MLLNILFSILGLILYFFLKVGKLYELVTYIIWLNLYLHFDNIKTKPLALKNSLKIIKFEKKYNFFYERKIQFYIYNNYINFYNFLNFIYLFNHFSATLGLYFYLLFTNNEENLNFKVIFYLINLITLIIQKKIPCAPPRLMEIENKFNENKLMHIDDKINIYGSMPSLHIGYALWVSHFLTNYFNNSIFFFHLLLTSVTIVVTGHHYILDIIPSIFIYYILYLFIFI